MVLKATIFGASIVVLGAVSARANDVVVPEGTMPIVDGRVSETEWVDAIRLPFVGGRRVLVKHSGSYLCVALLGDSGGIGSLGLCTGDTLRILHASTGLITAKFVNGGKNWQRLSGFSGPEVRPGQKFGRGSVRQGAEYRDANLLQFGWTANIVELGPAAEMEFVVNLACHKPGSVRMSAVFLQIKANTKYAYLPAGLADASLNRALVAGTAGVELAFDPAQWQSLKW